MTSQWRYDRGDLLPPVETEEGYLLLEGFPVKPGILTYRKSDGSTVRELVLPEELYKADSLISMGRKPVTLEHPEVGEVTPDNVGTLAVGDVDGEVEVASNGFVRVKMAVRRADAIGAIRGGKVQLSPGYTVDVDPTPGVHEVYGPYDAIQRNRRYNHVAIVGNARGGPSVRLRFDSEDAEMIEPEAVEEAVVVIDEDIAENKQEAEAAAEAVAPDDNQLSGMIAISKALGLSEDADVSAILAKISAMVGTSTTVDQSAPSQDAAPQEEPPMDEKAMIAYAEERAPLLSRADKHGIKLDSGLSNAEMRKQLATSLRPSLRKDAADEYYSAALAIIEDSSGWSGLSFDGSARRNDSVKEAPTVDPQIAMLHEARAALYSSDK